MAQKSELRKEYDKALLEKWKRLGLVGLGAAMGAGMGIGAIATAMANQRKKNHPKPKQAKIRWLDD